MSILKRKLDEDQHVKICKAHRPYHDFYVATDTDCLQLFDHTSNSTDTTRSRFLRLPTELRLEIYTLLFRACQTYPKRVKKEGIARKHSALPAHVPTSPSKSKSTKPDPPGTMVFKLSTDETPPPYYQLGIAGIANIIFVNKQIYNEAQPMYWRYVTVKIRADSVRNLVRFLKQPNWNQNGQIRNLLIEPFKPRTPYIYPSDLLSSGLRFISTNWPLRRLTLLLYFCQQRLELQPEADVLVSNLYQYAWIPEVEIAWHVTQYAPPLEELELWLKRVLPMKGIHREVKHPLWSTWYPGYSLMLSHQ